MSKKMSNKKLKGLRERWGRKSKAQASVDRAMVDFWEGTSGMVLVDDEGYAGELTYKKSSNTKDSLDVFFGSHKIKSFKRKDKTDPRYEVEYNSSKLFIYSTKGVESFRPIGRRRISHIVTDLTLGDNDNTFQRSGEIVDGVFEWSEWEKMT